jgi:hypothetical protein
MNLIIHIGFRILYFIDLVFEVLLIKALTYYFKINNLIYTGLVFGSFLPFFIYKLLRNYSNPSWNDLFNGFLDFINLVCISISVNGFTISRYIPIGTFTLICIGMIIYKLPKSNQRLSIFLKYFGFIIVTFAILLLMIFYSSLNYFIIIICFTGTLFYTIDNLIIENYIENKSDKELNYYWSKTISSLLNLSMVFNHTDVLPNESLWYFLIILFLIAKAENIYYFLKIIINKYESSNLDNNQIVINYIDVIRRLSSLIISVLLYQNIIYVFIFVIICISISLIPFGNSFKPFSNGFIIFNIKENNIDDSIV